MLQESPEVETWPSGDYSGVCCRLVANLFAVSTALSTLRFTERRQPPTIEASTLLALRLRKQRRFHTSVLTHGSLIMIKIGEFTAQMQGLGFTRGQAKRFFATDFNRIVRISGKFADFRFSWLKIADCGDLA